MAGMSNLLLTIDFSDSDLDSEDLETLTQSLYEDIDSLEEVESVERIREKPAGDVKAGAEDLGKLMVGVLTTQIPLPTIKPVVNFLFSRLSSKKVKVKAEANGKTIELETVGTSKEEVLVLIEQLKDFVEKA